MEKGPWDRILDWLERVLPTAIVAFAAGFKQGLRGKSDVDKKLSKAEYELEKMQNSEKIRMENAHKTARDIVDAHLAEIRRRNDSEGSKR